MSAPFIPTNLALQDNTTYRGDIDGNFAVAIRALGRFCPHQAATPNMTVVVDPGFLLAGSALVQKGNIVFGNTNGTINVTNLSTTFGLVVGQPITGQDMGTGNTIASINVAANSLTLSTPASGTHTGVTMWAGQQTTGTITAPAANPRIDRVVVDVVSGIISVVTGTEATTPVAPAVPSGKSPLCQILLLTSSSSITNSMITPDWAFEGLGIAPGQFGPQTSLASATTTDLGSIGSSNILVTGTTNITSFGASASINAPLFFVQFSGVLTLTNSGSLALPGGQNIKTAANDALIALALGSGNWRVLEYMSADGGPVSMTGNEITLASATTTDLGTAGTNLVAISGTTTITGLGSAASVANPLYLVRFTGILLLTYNASSLILPGSASITTAAGDEMTALYLGSGNWRIVSYYRASGQALISSTGAEVSVVSATTTNLGAAGSNVIAISGTTTITSFGSSAAVSNPIYFVRFTGSLVLTFNATSLLLPGNANITTLNGESMVLEYLGSGNWKCLQYMSQMSPHPTTAGTYGATDATKAIGQIVLDGFGRITTLTVVSLPAGGTPGTPSGGGGPCCFLAGTKILMATGKWSNIEDVRVGDMVMGRFGEPNPVFGLSRPLLGPGRHMWNINGELSNTADHLTWSEHGWGAISKVDFVNHDYRATLPVHINNTGGIELIYDPSINPETVVEFRIGDKLGYGAGYRPLRSLTKEFHPADTQLHSLRLGGSHTMQLRGAKSRSRNPGGYVISGFATDEDFDFTTWKPKG